MVFAALTMLWALRPTYTDEIAPAQIGVFAGRAYSVRPHFKKSWFYFVQSDSLAKPTGSGLMLFEDGVPLGPAHTPHRYIGQTGAAFSHWGGAVLFSSSDGSDPRSNGRRYAVRATAEPRPQILWAGIALMVAGVAGALAIRHQLRFPRLVMAAPRAVPAVGAALLLGAAAAEGLTRLSTHPAIDFTSIFSPGPYCPESGTDGRRVVICPRIEGVMRVPGTRRYAVYRTDELGFRGPFRGGDTAAGPVKRVIMIGGQSQGFGFGLNDRETYAAVAARSACGPVEIRSIAAPGTPNSQGWDIYKEAAGASVQADHVILTFYITPEPNWQESIEFSRLFIRSAFLYGWMFDGPAIPEPFWNLHSIVRSNRRLGEIRDYAAGILAPALSISFAKAEGRAVPAASGAAHALAGRQDFVRAVADWARRMGAEFSVVLLPGVSPETRAMQVGLTGIRVLDVDAAARESGAMGPLVVKNGVPQWAGYMPDGHYDADGAAFIGRLIGREICRVDFPGAAGTEPGPSVARR